MIAGVAGAIQEFGGSLKKSHRRFSDHPIADHPIADSLSQKSHCSVIFVVRAVSTVVGTSQSPVGLYAWL